MPANLLIFIVEWVPLVPRAGDLPTRANLHKRNTRRITYSTYSTNNNSNLEVGFVGMGWGFRRRGDAIKDNTSKTLRNAAATAIYGNTNTTKGIGYGIQNRPAHSAAVAQRPGRAQRANGRASHGIPVAADAAGRQRVLPRQGGDAIQQHGQLAAEASRAAVYHPPRRWRASHLAGGVTRTARTSPDLGQHQAQQGACTR